MLKRKLTIPLLFMLLALTLIIIPWHSGYIYSGSDVRFHINRIAELVHGLNKGFPLVNFLTFNGVGYDVNSFYPLPLLYLFSPIFLIKNPVNAFYLFLSILLFLTQFSTYLAGRGLKMSKKNAVLLAMLYTFSEYMMFVYLFAFELGEALAFIAFPLVLIAVISYVAPSYVSDRVTRYRDELFVLSLTWVTYSHVLSMILCLLIIIPVLLFFVVKDQDWKLLKRYVILGFCYTLTTSFFWINLFQAYLHQGIVGPEKYLSVLTVQQLLTNSLENKLTTGNVDPLNSVGIGIVLLVVALFLIANYNSLDKVQKAFVIFAGAFFILSTGLFCWSFIDSHFKSIETIQFTFRFLIIVVLMLSFAVCLYHKVNWKTILLVGTCIAVFNISSIQNFVNMGQGQETLSTLPKLHHEPRYADFKVNGDTFKYLYQGFYGANGGPADYLTYSQKKAFNSIATHQVLVNGRTVKAKYEAQTNKIKYQFQLSKKGTVDLPVLKTAHRYQITDNGRVAGYMKSKRGTLSVKGRQMGKHVIRIQVMPSILFKLSIVLTLMGLGMILVKFRKDRLNTAV